VITFHEAWEQALYGDDGFYRREAPGQHFRTSVHASALFATAVVRLARAVEAECVTDIGAGRGELGLEITRQAPDLVVRGIELDDVLPNRLFGLVIANEWLDNVPCPLVELDHSGAVRYVSADGLTLGDVADSKDLDWLTKWWPLTMPGDRAEVGLKRDLAWADVVRRLEDGLAVAIDYGHLRASRPPYGTLTGFRGGRECEPIPDGTCDITAHVALDSLAAAVPGGALTTQREALQALGISGARPNHALARTDPLRYVAELSSAGEAAELLDPSGLGSFGWVWCAVGEAAVRRASRALSA
jgi:SAM-dependent MidA family methyltransferase